MYVNARAIIERESCEGLEIVLQVRNKPEEGRTWIELPGGRLEEYESLIDALRREVSEETGLQITHIQGQESRLAASGPGTLVECLRPFAVYQTLSGPVDSVGAYFRCRAEGELLEAGDDTQASAWVAVERVAAWIQQDPDHFSWVDRAGLLFYLRELGLLAE